MSIQPLAAKTAKRKSTRPPPKQKYSVVRAFYTILLIAFAIAGLGAFTKLRSSFQPASSHSLISREIDHSIGNGFPNQTLESTRRNEECRLVHTVQDQCAFVRANCPDEEAGLFSYLQLYYCKLHHAQPLAFVILLLWLGLLFSTIGIAASDFFCINLSTIASILGMSESMTGVTFLAFGNGSPDVFSTFAAMKTHSGSLAVGELIGAACFITAVVAGSMALVRPFKVARKSFIRDVGFFIVAASFSMVFLADGHLHLWECAVMVGFYIFYVVIVVIWHWYLGRRSRRRHLEEVARSHFHTPGADDVEYEEYHDEDDEDSAPGGSRPPTRTISTSDFINLERASSPMMRPMEDAADVDDETRDRYLAEISSNMRVSRPKRGERRNTINPIRPSLVGALEFRSVLSSLQKSRNIQTVPINLRRYSDDPTFTAAQQQNNTSSLTNPEIDHDRIHAHDVATDVSLRSSVDAERTGPNRIRAVSANDAEGLQLDPKALRKSIAPRLEVPGATTLSSGGLRLPAEIANHDQTRRSLSPPRSDLSIPVPSNDFGYLSTSPAVLSPLDDGGRQDLLTEEDPQSKNTRQLHPDSRSEVIGSSPAQDHPPLATKPHIPKIQIPQSPTPQRSRGSSRSSGLSPFPLYHDDPDFMAPSRSSSLRLPPPSIGSESTFAQNPYESEDKPLLWWPYKMLPSPQVLALTLFPTLYSWQDKNIWDKLLGVVAAPSVFLLAITLPVVEADKDEEDDDDLPAIVNPDPGLLSPHAGRSRRGSTLAVLPPDSPPSQGTDSIDPAHGPNDLGHRSLNIVSPAIKLSEPESDTTSKPLLASQRSLPSHHLPSNHPAHTPKPAEPTSSAKDWNRWLVATQLFTAPFFIVVLVWANTDPTFSIRNLLLPCLYSLVGSLLAFAILLLTTTPSRAPKYRFLLCFLGFVVSIARISNIDNEVVGVLKAFGIILGISDAILGLTIFAVGNSLGDLVADITVARLGYPVMALSACFGGPLLNILLGIGLGGLYMTISSGEEKHEKHPGRPLQFKPYQIEVGGTLLISGITLLVTLAGLLIVVPLNGWWIDRKVGWGLIALWTLSTIGNVIVEVLGWGKEF